MDLNLKLLITGTGRSGTKFIRMMLDRLGYPCDMEKRFNYGGYSGDHKFTTPREASWMAAPHLDKVPNATTVHIVRHPRLVIVSMSTMGLFTSMNVIGYRNYANKYLPSLDNFESPIDKAAHFYLEWNKMLEGKCDFFHRVEDRPEILLKKLGINEPINQNSEQYYQGRLRISHEGELPITEISEELRGPLLEMMERYGYESWS